MKEGERPEETQEQSRYRVNRYGKGRNFAAYAGKDLIAVTVYRRGAVEIIKRLEEKDRRIGDLENQLVLFTSPPQIQEEYDRQNRICWGSTNVAVTRQHFRPLSAHSYLRPIFK